MAGFLSAHMSFVQRWRQRRGWRLEGGTRGCRPCWKTTSI